MNTRLSRTSFLLGIAVIVGCCTAAFGANPTEGTLNPGSATPLQWDGNIVGASVGGAGGEASCVDGTSCDVFTIHLTGSPEAYAGQQLLIQITFSAPQDYDLYVHKDSVDGKVIFPGENGGPPGTSEQVSINPATSGAGDYVVHVLYGVANPAAQYHGTAQIQSASNPSATPVPMRTANYVTGGITFSNNIPLKAPTTLRDGEPSNRTDFAGNAYVGGIRGFPAGVDIWRFDLNPLSPSFDPNMRVPIYRGQPDAFSPAASEAELGGDGGGDIDLAVPFSLPPGQTDPTLSFCSLIAANISTGNSTDRAGSFQKNPIGNGTGGIIVDDRQWQEFLGNTTVYMWYRTLQPAVTQIQRSDDGGLTFGPAVTAGTTTQVGPIDVHQSDGVVYAGTSQGTVVVGTPASLGVAPTSYTVNQAATDPNGVAHLFFVTKVADDGTPNGTVYVCYSNDKDILLKHSTDKGATWSDPVRVNNVGTDSNVFPWMETGPTPGSVGIVWYGTVGGNDDNAEWKVYYAQSFDATSNTPTFRQAEVTEPEHIIHAANISEGGLTGANNRNLIDYFQVSFDPQGAAVIAYTDDHNDYDGHTYVAHQIAGPSIKGGNLPAVVEGNALVIPPGTTSVNSDEVMPPRVPGLNGEQVTDYAQDLQEGNVPRIHQPDASDVLTTRYDTSGTGSSLAIAATMRVSDLSVIPGQTTWQMSFAVNAPHNVLSPTGTYSFAASDHADQFYLEADTDVNGNMTYSYGLAQRANDGKLIYTMLGAADAGAFNLDDNTVSVQVSVAKLNAVLATAGRPLIGNGTVVAGLRSRSYTIEVVPPVSGQGSRQGRRDIALGGTQFIVHDSAQPGFPSGPTPTPYPPPFVAPGSTPAPTPPRRRLANLATRVNVQGGQNDGIAGFIKRNPPAKRILIRAVGPSIGIGGALSDPILRVFDSTGAQIAMNDDWRSTQQAEISASGLAPKNDKEAALIINLPASTANTIFTAILSGANGATGIGVVEVYDLDAESFADLGNVATRGFVGSGANVLIGGFIVNDDSFTGQPQNILVRGIGPSLGAAGVTNALQDPVIELHDAQGGTIISNDDWGTSPDAAALTTSGLAPTNPKESAILRTLAPGAYTVILSGMNGGTGVGSVEAYNLGNQ
ncbi:MAG: sialidase family protein [Chthoniobacterales bacterium]